MLTIGVLALQGGVRTHLDMVRQCGAQPVSIRRPDELLSLDGLIVPGGESTTMIKLAVVFELLEPLRKLIGEGLPTLGTCAGMIMLADRIEDGIEGQETLGGIDMTVRRNAFGRQVDSFEASVDVTGFDSAYHAVFIRAPSVERVGARCTPIARVPAPGGTDTIVAVRQDRLVATSFHPELTDDTRIHDYFVRLVKEA